MFLNQCSFHSLPVLPTATPPPTPFTGSDANKQRGLEVRERRGGGGRFEYTNDNHLSNKSKQIRTAMDAEREEGREGNRRRWKNGG